MPLGPDIAWQVVVDFKFKILSEKNYEIATCALLPFFLSAPIVYGDVIILWEKRIQADDEDGALIISHKVPSGVIEFATSSAKCREKNPVTIELDDVAEIDKITIIFQTNRFP
jgi:hypothetical protein